MRNKSHPDITLKQATNIVMSWIHQSNVSGNDTENNMSNKHYICCDTSKALRNQIPSI